MPASDRPDTEAAERRYEEAAAKVDLSDLAVVKRHVYTANPKEWPKPLLYALLAALASEKQRAELAEAREHNIAKDYAELNEMFATAEHERDERPDSAAAYARVLQRLAAAEQVIAAAAELVALHDGREEHGPRISRAPTKREWGLLRLSLANYHTATTEPGAEP